MIESSSIQETEQALRYLILPLQETAIPVTDTLQETLASFLASTGDFSSSLELTDYPVVSKRILLLHFPAYHILPVLRVITRSIPERMETYLQRSARRDRERIERAAIQRDKTRHKRRCERESREIEINITF